MDMQKIKKAIKEHVWGPVGSVVFHVLLVVVLLKFAHSMSTTQYVDVEVQVMDIKPVEMDKLQEKLKELEKPEELEEMPDIKPPDVVDMTDVNTESPNPTDANSQTFGTAPGDFNQFDVVADVSAPLRMKGLYEGRSSGGRNLMGNRFGGRHFGKTEAAVLRALEWLKRNQQADGSWGPDKPAMTGLGLLTFLAHGETQGSKKYGPTVRKAIEFLMKVQREDGSFGDVYGNTHAVYEHAIAAYALCEAYALCRIPELKDRMEKAVRVIVQGQQAGGLWDYKYAKGDRRDLSVSGWQVQALKAGYINGAEVEGLKAALDKAVTGVKTMQNPETGTYGYSSPMSGNKMSMTGVGVLCLQLMNQGQDKAVKAGLQALGEASCDWQKPPPWPMYAWYYITQAKYQSGSMPMWNSWNDQFAPELTKYQVTDGSAADGSWPVPAGSQEEASRGPVYSTTLAALTLQVYYRILPTYKQIKVEEATEEKKDDVTVEII